MRKFFGLFKSRRDNRDYLITPFLTEILDKLPSEIDNTSLMTPIKHQGREGACAGFAGVAVKEYQEKIDYNLEGDKYIDLSERFLYEHAKKISGHKEGTTLKAIAKVLVDKGVCRESFWKYKAGDVGQPFAGAEFDAYNFKVQPYYTRITNEKELKASLVKFGAIMIGVGVYRNWYRQKNGHIPDAGFCDKLKGCLGGHAIVIVGYNDKTKEYKFKNSWGIRWGDKGYGYLSYKEMRRTLMDAIAFIDINDERDYEDIELKQIKDLSFIEKIKAWK